MIDYEKVRKDFDEELSKWDSDALQKWIDEDQKRMETNKGDYLDKITKKLEEFYGKMSEEEYSERVANIKAKKLGGMTVDTYFEHLTNSYGGVFDEESPELKRFMYINDQFVKFVQKIWDNGYKIEEEDRATIGDLNLVVAQLPFKDIDVMVGPESSSVKYIIEFDKHTLIINGNERLSKERGDKKLVFFCIMRENAMLLANYINIDTLINLYDPKVLDILEKN